MKCSKKLAAEPNPLAFLLGGGEMGSLIRSMDWSATPLGPVEAWPQSLRTTVSICLASDLPICIIWGPGLVQLYNDAYRVICGNKHPRSMGQNFSACWKEAWPVIGEAHDSALAGDTAFLESQQIFLERHGYVEECFFTFSFSPVRDEAGRVGGLFHPVIEMTTQMLSERRTRALHDLTAQTGKAKSVSEALSLSANALAAYAPDLPFVLLYELEPDSDQALLVSATDLQADPVAGLNAAGTGVKEQPPWPLEEVVRSGSAVQVHDVRQRIGLASFGPYPEPPDEALALPIILPGASRPAAVFIAGVSARLRMNEAYRSFYDMLATAVTTAAANARAHDDERRRAKALAELDRAKTTFFSNVSHEFRTPLTLMLGPIEDALSASSEHLPPSQRERLEVVHRNGLRLHRLVNTLLDFSRIEAGRVRAAYEPTALADLTADLASNFRSACEKAGLELRVDCPPLSEPVFVDSAMWEKIVLNLLSNAFKFTFEGEIAVSLRQTDHAVELRVRDTGTGVPAEEIPRLFERFHRIENARGRTHEGSGIGLALVQELVKLHGGSITAESEVGRGTTFTVSIPLGSKHLAQDQVGNRPAAARPSMGPSPFVEEALHWLPDAFQRAAPGPELPSIQDDPAGRATSPVGHDDERPLVLVADDNADMRKYVVRLLDAHYRIEVVPDGEAALAAARERLPDLILTDVMMPRLDGFRLLQALRADPRTSGVPVIMLSARAGEESRIEGMQKGADDYLAKPFSARELLARVEAHLKIARLRRESSEALRASEEQFRALVSASSDVVYRMNADWTELRHLQGREFIADTHEPNRSWLEKYIPLEDQPRILEVIQAAIRSKGIFELEHRVMRVDGTLGWAFSRAIPMLDGHGQIKEWFGAASDVTARKQGEAVIQASEARSRAILESITDGFFALDSDWRFTYINAAGERFLDCTPGDLIGKSLWEQFPGTVGSEFEQVYRQVVARQVSESFTAYYPNFDRWYEATAYPAPDGLSVYFRDVTKGRQVDQERQQFAALVAASSDFIGVAGLDQRSIYVNRAGQALVGLEPGQVSGINVLDFFPESERDNILSHIADSEGGEQLVLDTWFQHLRTGQLIPVSWSFLRLRDASGNVSGYATVTRDLTERNNAESLLRASEERRRLALNAAELGTWYVDPATRATKTDARYRAIFGTTGEWTDYMEAVAVIHPDDQPAVLEAVAAATRLEDPAPYAIEYRIVHPDGSLRWVLANGRSSLEGAGLARRVVSFDGTVADITDRKRGEIELIAALAAAESANQAKSDFLSRMSHELRSPLNAVLGFAQLLQLGTPPPTAVQEKNVGQILKAGWYLLGLIDEILDLSQIESGRLTCVLEPVPLAEVLDDCQALVEGQAQARGIRLNLPQKDDLCIVTVDRTRMKQVFINLLSNAIKYNRQGGTVQVHVEAIGHGRVCIRVEDTGTGLSPEQLGHIFEPFERLGQEAGSIEGTGIGLALSKGLVELMGGRIGVESVVGQGSVFWVELDAPGAQVSAPPD